METSLLPLSLPPMDQLLHSSKDELDEQLLLTIEHSSINTTNDTTLSYLSETMALLGRLEAAKSELQSLCDINTKCSLMKACLESGDLSTAIQHYCTFFEQPHLAGEVSEAGATSNVYSFVEAYFTSSGSEAVILKYVPFLFFSFVKSGILSPSSASIGPSKSYVELIELLMSPIRKSFKFHFYGKRPTNSLKKRFLFDENMRENYISPELFSTTWKSCAEIVLENESVFALWADLERQATEVRFKEIVSDPDRWTMALVKMSDIDDDHTLVFSERMQSLFDAISHRCRRLQKYEQRVEFSRLVHLPVLHQFLDILSQELWRHQSTFIPINDPRYNLPYKGTRISHMACCLGSIHSIATSIRLWSKELLLYGDPSVDDTDIFSATLVSYDELIAKIAHVSIEDIMLDISESLWEYERRYYLSELEEPIHTISHYLGCVKSHLSVPLFRKHFLRPVTRLIDERIWEKLVVRGQFSFRGGSQFSLDVRLGFLHSLQPMHPSPAALLPRLSEASTILALPVEATETDQVDIYSIMLAAIEDGEELMPMLERIGVFQLTSKEVREVVGRRIEALGEF
ncbi:hypothetical protein BSLG_003816 [Batrachochytrium salamandrivorans]|nr:hypothetical protein BSLG_003816 [Batrachochytrium salamandrivorans]